MSDAAYFLNPDGQVISVDAGQASLVSGAKGYTPATPDQIADFQATEKYGGAGQQALAGAEGLARGLSGRLSTAAEVGLGVDPEGIIGRERAHPGTAMGSEALGVAIPLIATFGTEAPVAGGLRAAAELTAPSLIAKAGAAAGSRIAGGMVEGALYGVGNVVHEAALGDPNLTAQAVLAQVGLSAALGGGIGGVVSAGESGLRAALGRARESVRGLAEGLATPEKLRGSVQEAYTALRGARATLNQAIKPEEFAAMMDAIPPEAARAEALRLDGVLDEKARLFLAEPDRFEKWGAAEIAKLRKGAVTRAFDADNAYDSFTELEEAKRLLYDMTKTNPQTVGRAELNTTNEFLPLHAAFKTSLENADVWGEAGARQAALNETQSGYARVERMLEKTFGTKGTSRSGRPSYTMDASKLAGLSDIGSPKQPLRQTIFREWQEGAQTLINEIDNSAQNLPVSGFDRDAVTSLVNKTGEMEQATRQQGTVLRMLGRMGGVGPMGTMAGGIVGGPVGAAIGAGIDIVAKGAKYIPKAVDALSSLHANNEAVSKAIETAAARFASGSAKVARIGREEVAAGIPRAFGMDAEEASAHFDKHADKIRSLTASPDRMQEALEGLTTDIHEHAPQTAQALTVTAARAVSFLASKMPPTIKPGPLSEPLPLSASQIATYNRYREAVEHPESLLRQASAGTLTPETIEAVKAVYPHLFMQMQGAVMEKIRPDSPYRTKLMASMLLGRDLDGTMNGPAILREQMRYVKPPPQAMPSKPTKGGAAKLHISERVQTNSQRAAGGR